MLQLPAGVMNRNARVVLCCRYSASSSSCLWWWFFTLFHLFALVQGHANWYKEDFSNFPTGAVVQKLQCGSPAGGIAKNCTVTVTGTPGRALMIFNSSYPTGNDVDLGTPNERYGGPGTGTGGSSNTKSRGNVLIISKDNNTAVPNDNEGKGNITFDFNQPMLVNSFGILDNDKGFRVMLWDSNGDVLYSKLYSAKGDNAFQLIAIKVAGAIKMQLQLNGSGAITEILYAPVPSFPSLKDFTTLPNNETRSFFRSPSTTGVSIDGETIVIGSYVYVKKNINSSTTAKNPWKIQAILADNQTCGCYSAPSALSNNTVIVGRNVYVRNDGRGAGNKSWTLQWTFNASSSGTPPPIAIDGDTLVVSNTVYVRNTNQEWTQQAVLPLRSRVIVKKIVISGNTIAFSTSTGGINDDSVQVFVRKGTRWGKQATLVLGDNPTAGSTAQLVQFGQQFDLDGDTIVIEAVFDYPATDDFIDDDSMDTAYSEIYLFTYKRNNTVGTWVAQQQELFVATVGVKRYQTNLALNKDTLAHTVGTCYIDNSGSFAAGLLRCSTNIRVYQRFVLASSSWTQLQQVSTGLAPSISYLVAVSRNSLVTAGYDVLDVGASEIYYTPKGYVTDVVSSSISSA